MIRKYGCALGCAVSLAACSPEPAETTFAEPVFSATCDAPTALGATDVGLVDEIDETCLVAGSPHFRWLSHLSTPSPDRCYTAPDHVELAPDKALVVVTHLTTEFDLLATLEPLAEQYLACQAADPDVQVVYLENTSDRAFRYYVRDIPPDYTVFSNAGEVPFEIPTNRVSIIGGYYSLCFQNTVADVLIRWKGREDDLTVTIIAPLIYEGGISGLPDLASRPGILDLYRDQGGIVTLSQGLAFVRRAERAPFLAESVELALAFAVDRGGVRFPQHRVVLRYGGDELVVREHENADAPTLLIHFEG